VHIVDPLELLNIAPVEVTGPDVVLPSWFDVTGLATDAVAAATAAAAQLLAARTGTAVRSITIDRVEACAAFASERLFEPLGWELPAAWDPIAGDYLATDAWIRLHTNYAHHRTAVLRALGLPLDADRSDVASSVAERPAGELETAVVQEGGAAAMMRTNTEWLATPAGVAAATEPLIHQQFLPPTATPHLTSDIRLPLEGIRILDLTRVIAGPVCTRFLAAYGADVVRVDPPNFHEVPALLPDVTVGKHCTVLDLTGAAGRTSFERLVSAADVIVSGYRDGALARLGYAADSLRRLNPSLITATLDAYGWTGPWQRRRGFDSLVQMSSGIAAAPGVGEPRPLPAQVLDHGTGYLLAAAICQAVMTRHQTGRASDLRASLIATANLLQRRQFNPSEVAQAGWPDSCFIDVDTWWGAARQVRIPGRIDGVTPRWTVNSGPLGRHEPSFC
jgi:hypothetical protein